MMDQEDADWLMETTIGGERLLDLLYQEMQGLDLLKMKDYGNILLSKERRKIGKYFATMVVDG